MQDDAISVLHLDDDRDFLELTRTFLEREAARLTVQSETDAATALTLLAAEPVDCVVTDYKMAGVDGLELLERIRTAHPELPVVFFTGKGSEEIAVEAIHLGVTDYIRKGTGTEQYSLLANRIESLVSGERAKREAAAADRRIRQVYERITVAFIALDDELRFTYLNDEAEALVGQPTYALVGTALFDAFPSVAETDLGRALETAMVDQQETHVEGHLDVDDEWLALEVHAYPSGDGVSVFLEDLTDQRAHEAQLEELRTQLEVTNGQFRTLHQKVARPRSPFRRHRQVVAPS